MKDTYDYSIDELYDKIVPESMRKEIELNEYLIKTKQKNITKSTI